MNLGNIAREIHCIAIEKGWYNNPKLENEFIESACNNLHDEVSELHEAWRNNKLFELCDKAEKMKEIGVSPYRHGGKRS